MAKYHKVSLRLTKLQRRKLLMRKPVQVNLSKMQVMSHPTSHMGHKRHNKIGVHSEIFLNGHQVRAFKNRYAKGKGYRLSFTQDQLRHNIQHGSGFSDLLGKAAAAAKQGYSMIPDEAKNYVKDKAVDYVKDKALNFAKDQGSKLLGKALSKFKGKGIVGPGGGGIEAPGWH